MPNGRDGESDVTRKHFEVIAMALYTNARPFMSHNEFVALVHTFVDVLTETNPRFDRHIFECMCNHGKTG